MALLAYWIFNYVDVDLGDVKTDTGDVVGTSSFGNRLVGAGALAAVAGSAIDLLTAYRGRSSDGDN